MTRIYLIRHAQAEGNLCCRMHGQYDSNLTALGLRQLVDLQARFENIHVDACYCSDLTRAKNTAMAICIPNNLSYCVDPGFREVGVGIWEDMPFGYLNTFHGLKMVRFGLDQVNWKVDGSENYREYTSRFLYSLESAALRHAGGTIAIVSHSIVMGAVLRELFPDVRIPQSANTAVSCLEYENGAYRIVYLNDSSHLDRNLYTASRLKWWQQPGAQGDDMFWFREGWTDVGLDQAPKTELVYTVIEDQKPVGLICLSEEDAETGRVEFIGLIPEYRGYDLTVQLFGQAISALRSRGKKKLLICLKPEDPIQKICKKLPFVSMGNFEFALDLTGTLYPF